MTIDQIIARINAAPASQKVELAENLLKEYNEDDKEIVEPWILEMAILETKG
jgi:hypothetical protein